MRLVRRDRPLAQLGRVRLGHAFDHPFHRRGFPLPLLRGPYPAPVDPSTRGMTCPATDAIDRLGKFGAPPSRPPKTSEIGRASCRERGCQYVEISGGAGGL